MSKWHANTKSVKSYGKNRTRVVKVLVDLSDDDISHPSPASTTFSSPAKGRASTKVNFVRSATALGAVLQDKNGRGGSAPSTSKGVKKVEAGCGGKKAGGGVKSKKEVEVLTVGSEKDVNELDSTTEEEQEQENVPVKSRRSTRASIESTSSVEREPVARRSRNKKLVVPSTPPSPPSSFAARSAPSTTATNAISPSNYRAATESPAPNHRRSKRAVVPATPPSSVPSPTKPDAVNSDFDELDSDQDDEDIDSNLTTLIADLTIRPNSDFTASDSPLNILLGACNQTTPPSPFTPFLFNPLFFPSSSSERIIMKVGEATYSEVFSLSSADGEGGSTMVMKVVPLLSEEQMIEIAEKVKIAASENQKAKEVDELEEEEEREPEPTFSDPRDVAKEVSLGRLVGELDGFCNLIGAFVVQGPYPDQLLAEWDEFAEMNPDRTENARPSVFSPAQLYAVLLLPYGGVDLESFSFSKSRECAEAAGIFWSVVQAVAVAEEEVRFEHRDLHLGQILVQPSSSQQALSSSGPFDTTSAFETTIIDFGLSRVDAPEDEVWWTPLDKEIFEGKGRQWDVYRSMRDHVGDDWTGFHPQTNLMWLLYLLTHLLRTLPRPQPSTARFVRSTSQQPQSSPDDIKALARENEAWKCLDATRKEVERGLKVRGTETRATRGAGGKEKEKEDVGAEGARGLVQWGRGKGWCA